MGACISFPRPPNSVSISLPGGAKLVANAKNTHNQCDPFDQLFQISAPALGTIQPIFDITGFAIAVVDLLLCLIAFIGVLALVAGNPVIAAIFPLPMVRNTADNVPVNGFLEGETTDVPDVQCVIDNLYVVVCKALKLVALVPQLSMIATIKDSLNTILALMSCVQAQFNGLSDAASLVPGPTGDPVIDAELDCARAAIADFGAHAAGPLTAAMPIMQLIGKLAEPIQQGLPAPAANLIRLAVNLGLIPMPDDAAKTQFLGLVDQLQAGTLIEIPDFSDFSDLAAKMDEIRSKLGPITGAIEQVQKLTEKLQNC